MVAIRDFVDADMTGVRLAAADLKSIRSRLGPNMRVATTLSAQHIRDAAKRNIKAQTKGVHTKWYPSTITWEMRVANASFILAEIGPEKRRKQGFLASILEFGSVNNGPKPHLMPAMDAEVDVYAVALAFAAERAVFGR